MLMTKRKPATVGEILVEEFMQPLGLTDFWLNVRRRSDLWEAMNSPRERERIEREANQGRRLTGAFRQPEVRSNVETGGRGVRTSMP